MRITTNNKPRALLSLSELPTKVADGFDYIQEDDAFCTRFVQYKGHWYDTQDCQGISTRRTNPVGWDCIVQEGDPLACWHAIVSETFFSGVLFRFVGNDDVVVGRYFA